VDLAGSSHAQQLLGHPGAKSYANRPGQLSNPVEKELFSQIAKKGPELKPFVHLPETGYIASHRRIGEHWVKIFVMGNRANAGHTHEDKGSFMLEFAGQAFATDLGVGEYDDPLHQLYKHAQRHNMLCPTGPKSARLLLAGFPLT